ncbi:hypothetical protein GCM10028798_15520 [Humibacter antri]
MLVEPWWDAELVVIDTPRLRLEPISPELAERIVAGRKEPTDAWHPQYPLEDELVPLRGLMSSRHPDPVFTLYLIRLRADGLAIGGLGFFGPPNEDGRIEFGYGLVAAARGRGLATEAVTAAFGVAAAHGARSAAADTDLDNAASQRVLLKAGMTEVARSDTQVFYERELSAT